VPIFPPVLMVGDASTNLENIEESVHSSPAMLTYTDVY
jgi:hypothetical protein